MLLTCWPLHTVLEPSQTALCVLDGAFFVQGLLATLVFFGRLLDFFKEHHQFLSPGLIFCRQDRKQGQHNR